MNIRLLKHTVAPAVPDSGRFEVRFPDERESIYFTLRSEEAKRKGTGADGAGQVAEIKSFRRRGIYGA